MKSCHKISPLLISLTCSLLSFSGGCGGRESEHLSISRLDSDVANARHLAAANPDDAEKLTVLAEALLKRGKLERTLNYPWRREVGREEGKFFREALQKLDKASSL